MIHEFSVANCLSIREPVVLDLRIPRTAPDLTCFRSSQAKPEVRLPTVVLVVGPNGAGKTTLLWALVRMFQIVSADLGDRRAIESVLPFMSSECRAAPTRFSVDLEADWLAPGEAPTAFRYVLEVKRFGDAVTSGTFENVAGAEVRVTYEALLHFPKGRPRRLLERRGEGEEIYVGAEFGLKRLDERLRAVRSDASALSTLNALNVPLAKQVVEQFHAYLHSTNLDMRGRLDTQQLLTMLDTFPGLMDRMRYEIGCSDLGIRDVKIRDTHDGKSFWFDHDGVEAPIPLLLESGGTQRLFHLLPQIDLALDESGLAVFDEIDDLHVDIVEHLIERFHSRTSNPSGAQLIMTSHNVSLLDGMEKEECHIVEKDASGATQVYSVADIQGLRRDAPLYRKYRAGVMGGLPNVG